MERVRQWLSHRPDPDMNDEQKRIRDWQSRIERRQEAIDVQIDVLRSDKRDGPPK